MIRLALAAALAFMDVGGNDEAVLWAPRSDFQVRAVMATEFEVFLGGAKGASKTDCIIGASLKQIHNPRYKAYITRETGPQLDEIKARMHRILPRMAFAPAWNGDGHGRWTWPDTDGVSRGAAIIYESIGTPVDAEKIQGQEPTFVGMDEAANIKEEKTIDMVAAELRSPDPTLRRQLYLSGNPGKAGQRWVKSRFINPCGKDGKRIIARRIALPTGESAVLTRRFIPGTVFDNPIYSKDPLYLAQLMSMPETLRKQLLYGDWDAAQGTALDELDEHVHIIKPFVVPDYWTRFGAFDYGFAHWWVWIEFAVQEDGRVFVVDSARGRRHQPSMIAERVLSTLNVRHPNYQYTRSDSYAFSSRKEREEDAPSISDILLADHDLLLSKATGIDRKKTLTNLRYYLAWRGLDKGNDAEPALLFFDTPNNRWGFEQLQAMVLDDADPEDVLKVDADPDTGEGGDDYYDALRVGMASRPQRPMGHFIKTAATAFSPTTLAYMHEQLYKDTPGIQPLAESTDTFTRFTGV